MRGALCPPPRELELLLAEGLDERQRRSAEAHVEDCATCQARLEDLVRDLQQEWPALTAALGDAPSEASSEDAGAFLRELRHDSGADTRSRSAAGAHAQLPHVAGYEILDEIGRGAVGIVYRARHLELNRLVAIKMILAGPYSSPRARQRFRLESQAIARLRHPHIVQVHDVGEQDGRLYLVLELVEGGNLAASIAEGPRTAAVAARIVAELAEAIEHAHAHGVIHRDLKPANVLFHDPARAGRGTGPGADTPATGTDSARQLKITDFGLAKVTTEDGLDALPVTQSGEFLGTPSYTAPEQARGDAKLVGPQADVYSLGAILYELLTGRPPFQGASVVETLVQVAHHEAVPVVRLVPGVPRDLDTICAKCLRKEPARRYATANELARDLRRFLAGEPIHARPVARIERTTRWIRRRPGDAAGIAGGVLLVALLAGAAAWSAWRNAGFERAVHAEFSEASRHAQASDWSAARAALERARVRLDGGGSDALKAQLARSSADMDMAARLEAVHLGRAAVEDGLYDVERNRKRADELYAATFAQAGFADVFGDPAAAAARIVASDIRRAWVAALDDWTACQFGAARADRRRALLTLAQRVEDDASGELARWRDPETWADRERLAALVETAPPPGASIELLIAVGDRLRQMGGDGVPLLERVQREHPDVFWANFALAEALVQPEPKRAARFYQAALALRPDSAVVANNLGRCLAVVGSPLEALPHLQRAVRIDPAFGLAHSNLGNAFTMLQRYDEAIAAGLEAVRLEPERAEARNNLGRSYVDAGRLDEALATYQRAAEIDPKAANVQSNIGSVLRMQGRLREAIEHGQASIELDPDAKDALNNLGLALSAAGRPAEALAYFDRALAIDADDTLVMNNRSAALRALGRLGEALATSERSLRTDEKDPSSHTTMGVALAELGRLDDAIAHSRRAVELAPMNPRMRLNLGIMLQTVGRTDEAVAQYRSGLELGPEHSRLPYVLGLALMELGDWAGARASLLAYLGASSPKDPARPSAQAALARVDRMAVLDERFPGVLASSDQPDDPAQALDFAEIADVHGRPAFAAQLAADAFARDPALADDFQRGARLDAARSAVLAGCGPGVDAAALDEDARLGWRTRARDWLRDDLVALEPLVADDRVRVRQNLARWQHLVDLAPVRDEASLAALFPDERAQWESFWHDVEALRVRAAREN